MALPVSRELAAVLSSSQTTQAQAADAIEEHIIYRRAKGDSLDDVSASLAVMEGRSPRLVPAIRQAQYVTNVPPSSARSRRSSMSHSPSQTPASVLSYLLSEPAPSVQDARQVILEYVLSREAKLREKKHGRGGKGTLGREGFEEIAARLAEIEDGLRGVGPLASPTRAQSAAVPDDELSDPRKTGLLLILSLRMLLSYFTLPDLAKQLLCQTPSDAERTLVQHIRRRVAGEGRFNVGRELEYVESLTLNRRPALRPAFRSARARTHLPVKALYHIALPAPSKSACIKLLNAFAKDIELAGPGAALAYMQAAPPNTAFTTPGERTSYRRRGSPGTASPTSPSPNSPVGSPVRTTHTLPSDATPLEGYTLELVCEFLTREKREYMLKNKWVKSGREQLSRDLGDIEAALCLVGKTNPSYHAPALLPTFLLLRRTFALPSSPLPSKVTESYYDMVPTLPDPDAVPLREPTVSSTTATLYVNPRLPDEDALDAMEELIENEREKGINASISQEKTVAWLEGLVAQVAKRFPDGSYDTIFDRARYIAAHPRVWPDASTSSTFPSHPVDHGAEPLGHRRSKSSAIPASPEQDANPPQPMRKSSGNGGQHVRSASMPWRSSSNYSESSRSSSKYSMESEGRADSAQLSNYQNGGNAMGDYEPHAGEGPDLSALGISSRQRNKTPPLLSLFVPGPELDLGAMDSPSSMGALSPPSSGKSTGGWWDVISAGAEASPAARRAPWTDTSGGSPSTAGSSMPGVSEPGSLVTPQPQPIYDLTPVADDRTPTSTPPKPYHPSDSPTASLMTGSPHSILATTPKASPAPHVQDALHVGYDREELVAIAPPPSEPPSLERTPRAPSPEDEAASAARAEALARLDGRKLDEAPASAPSAPAAPAPAAAPTSVPAQPEDDGQEDLYAGLDFMPAAYKPTMTKKPHQPAFSKGQESNLQRSMSRAGALARSASNANNFKGGAMVSGGRRFEAHDLESSQPEELEEQLSEPPGQGSLSGRPSAPPLSMERSGFATGRPSRDMQRDPHFTGSGESSPSAIKSKFSGFMSRGLSRREKHEPPPPAAAPTRRPTRGGGVANRPGQWNRDMVMGIMGPPVQRTG